MLRSDARSSPVRRGRATAALTCLREAVLKPPLVDSFEQGRPDQAHDAVLVGEAADDIGAAPALAHLQDRGQPKFGLNRPTTPNSFFVSPRSRATLPRSKWRHRTNRVEQMKSVIIALFVLLGHSPVNAEEFAVYRDKLPSGLLIEEFHKPQGIAPDRGGSLRSILPLALDLIKHFEGWVPSAYHDSVGYCTIGYGHLIALSGCSAVDLGQFRDGLSEAQGASLLEQDTAGARKAVQESVEVKLTDEQFGALTSFVFNVGAGNFRRSTLLRKLNRSQYSSASQEFSRWNMAGGQVLDGLRIRRACEAALFNGELRYAANKTFDRALCTVAGAGPMPGAPIDIQIGE